MLPRRYGFMLARFPLFATVDRLALFAESVEALEHVGRLGIRLRDLDLGALGQTQRDIAAVGHQLLYAADDQWDFGRRAFAQL